MFELRQASEAIAPEPYLYVQKRVERGGLRVLKATLVSLLVLLLVSTTFMVSNAFAATTLQGHWNTQEIGDDEPKYYWKCEDGTGGFSAGDDFNATQSTGLSLDGVALKAVKISGTWYAYTQEAKPTKAPVDTTGVYTFELDDEKSTVIKKKGMRTFSWTTLSSVSKLATILIRA